MEIYLVIASINKLTNIARFKSQFQGSSHEINLIVVDEGDEKLREKNRDILQGIRYNFYGPRERLSWFQEKFGLGRADKYASVIPERCHAETSFGFLVAYEEGADVVIELDDDVFPVDGHNLVREHLENLFHVDGVRVGGKCKWYNTIENLIIEPPTIYFPRGHPYSLEARERTYIWNEAGSSQCVLNMGLWLGHPDLDAVTILYHGGLDGRGKIHSKGLKRDKVIVDYETYFAVCSMNASFLPKIIPAFYQLYMNFMGIDRFDDIWSGIFVKKIADHLGDKISLGKPLVYHDKRARNVFKDLRSELEGMVMNEVFWRIVDEIELAGKDYYECYFELANKLEKNLDKFNEKLHKDFIKLQTNKMRLWLEIINKIR